MTPEPFIFSLVVNILAKLGLLILEEISLSWGLEKELKKLELTLSSIKAGLLDAEEKQARNHLVRDWLEKLQDLCLDADDLLDEIECEALRRQVVKDGRTSRKLRRFFSRRNPLAFRFNMSHEIKDIRERLKKIDDDKARFKLTEQDENSQNKTVVPRETHSFIRDTDVIGRKRDRDNIVTQLLSYGQSLSVIPILGIGGVGKTALAKLVYNDESVNKHFNKKIWVHVSVDFDAKKLIKEILKSGEKFYRDSTVDSLNSLQTKLQETLAGKRFLLVMDDVWNEDRAKWVEFRDLLRVGANGSKIIVTTRSREVAEKMGNVPTYNLKGLSDEDCWTVFVRCAFEEGEQRRFPNLVDMGYEIVKKCGGVPLVVRRLGCLLYSKTDERDWKHIKDTEIWCLPQYENDILPALKLSYDQLPSHHLKRCFAYCSMFPKKYEFSSDDLIQFWMAHDLIEPSKGNQDLEDIGEQYIKELQSRSFFQDESYDYNFTFKMHGLMHDLAMSVAPNTCSTVNSRTEQQDVSIRVRHLSFADPELSLERVPVFLNRSNRLRTIIFHDTEKEVSSSLDMNIIPRFQYLRMLNLSRLCFKVLPSSIGSMRHLRYLDLSCNGEIEELPRSVYKLQSLLTLKLDGCSELKTLPKKIGKLISLRFLGITTKDWYMPESGIGCLSSLRFLKFESCEYLETLFEDIQRLQKLQTLLIYNCRCLSSLPRGMSSLSSLKTLVISGCEKLNLRENLDGLRLRSLVLEDLPQLTALPEWLKESARTLEYMRIEFCPNLDSLPEWLQQFQSLQELVLTRCEVLSSLPEGMRRLSALQKLKISDCFRLTSKCQRPAGEDWNKIAGVPDIYVDSIKQ